MQSNTQPHKLLLIKTLKSHYEQLISDNRSVMNEIISQNMYLDNQLQFLELNLRVGMDSSSNFMPPDMKFKHQSNQSTGRINYQARNGWSNNLGNVQQAIENNLQYDNHEQNISDINSVNNDGNENFDDNMSVYSSFTHNSTRKSQRGLNSSNRIQEHHVSSYKPPVTGRLQDSPGNPIENRLITQFFTKYFPTIIEIDSNPKSLIRKKQILACYVKWRLGEVPKQKQLKLISIQVCISQYIRINLKQKGCEILRQHYNCMRFKSISTVKELMNFDLDLYKMFQRRGKPGRKLVDGKPVRVFSGMLQRSQRGNIVYEKDVPCKRRKQDDESSQWSMQQEKMGWSKQNHQNERESGQINDSIKSRLRRTRVDNEQQSQPYQESQSQHEEGLYSHKQQQSNKYPYSYSYNEQDQEQQAQNNIMLQQPYHLSQSANCKLQQEQNEIMSLLQLTEQKDEIKRTILNKIKTQKQHNNGGNKY